MLARSIHAYVRALFGESAPRMGPFLLGIDQHDDGRYRNYAVPDDGATPTSEEIETLAEAFTRNRRLPRLEYLPAMCPGLETALIANGFTVESRLPVMTCPALEASSLTVPGVDVVIAQSDAELWAVTDAQAEAYGQPDVTEHDLQRLRRVVDRGGLVALAYDTATGAAVGGGLCAPPHAGVSELAAIGVRAAYRRRGVAAALTGGLTRACRTAGITTPFLTPAGTAEQRIYERVGYRVATEMLHMSR